MSHPPAPLREEPRSSPRDQAAHHVEHRDLVLSLLLPAYEDSTKAIHPAVGALHDPAARLEPCALLCRLLSSPIVRAVEGGADEQSSIRSRWVASDHFIATPEADQTIYRVHHPSSDRSRLSTAFQRARKLQKLFRPARHPRRGAGRESAPSTPTSRAATAQFPAFA